MSAIMKALEKGINGSSALIAVAAFIVCWLVLGGIPGISPMGIASAVVVGLGSGVLIGKFTEYYTSYEYGPTKEISKQAETGPATVIIAGVAEGMKSTWASLAIIIVAIMTVSAPIPTVSVDGFRFFASIQCDRGSSSQMAERQWFLTART